MLDIKALCDAFLTPERRRRVEKLLDDKSSPAFYGLAGSSAAMLFASLTDGGRPMLIITESLDQAGYLYQDLSKILGENAVLIFPSGYKRDIKYGQVDPPSQILRTEVLNHWHSDQSLRYVVTYPEALAERVASRETLDSHTLHFRRNSAVDITRTKKWLRENGFTQEDYVYEPGHFAIRGSILDIFGYSNELPFRIDFLGDDIDSIRTFNIETQLSEKQLEEVAITSNATRGQRGVSLLEFIEPSTRIAVHDAEYVISRVVAIAQEPFSDKALIADEGDKNAKEQIVDADAFAGQLRSFRQIRFSPAAEPYAKSPVSMDFSCSPQSTYHKNFDLISKSFTELLANGYKIHILSESEKQIERLHKIFEDRGEKIPFTSVISSLHEGFVDNVTKNCVFTDHQIFDRFHKYTLKSDKTRSGKLALSLKELSQIEAGDYIVHVDHGVGKFAGLVRTNVNGSTQEMIKLVYQNDDIIFVSIHALHKLAKYRGKEGEPPRINRLGSGAWNKIKERTKRKLKDIARDLIKLYAARKEEPGFSFSPDSYLQHELEASFIYEDTPDQLTATQEVKADMESPRPMDRLICGDVGFGKTEIAIRAAFKAAADNKQTALLVPTTVLAYQHYNTFRERLKGFPVNIEYLSRARSPKQAGQIIRDLAAGKIDILIGTHRIIGKDVVFKDLGLLIIDEEQKFGVAVKEKLKQLKTCVDTLPMSATPIPRTLQFSLMGARDLSSITTPPANRFPITTSGNAMIDEIVADAINFEMSRNGQVFFVNNRIEELFNLESMIKRLVPDARTVIGHGQMPPDKLEKAIIDFTNHDYDVLLATTIIESGIDMPNVNTIIINNAQNFGLSELHQLRGRVGRSNRKAFCYLLVPQKVPLSPVARRRLQAIESLSELGSGIHIALQDLDIRGAGNLLGAEQSGFIADLGYETYQKILKEAVLELRTQEFSESFTASEKDKEYVSDCVVESDMELLLPSSYVPQESERISLYQELDNIDDSPGLDAFRKRLEDRFGKIPPETAELLRIPRLRQLARQLGIEKVALRQGSMYLYFVDKSNTAYYQSPMFGKIINYLQQNPGQCKIRETNGRRSIAILLIHSVEKAEKTLSTILNLETV